MGERSDTERLDLLEEALALGWEISGPDDTDEGGIALRAEGCAGSLEFCAPTLREAIDKLGGRRCLVTRG